MDNKITAKRLGRTLPYDQEEMNVDQETSRYISQPDIAELSNSTSFMQRRNVLTTVESREVVTEWPS